ncbi:hypothetical protein GCM10027059_50100 [Myceligenerans halotolerans]
MATPRFEEFGTPARYHLKGDVTAGSVAGISFRPDTVVVTPPTTVVDSSPEALRRRMVEEMTAEGVLDDPAIARAFATVPREVFLPAGIPAADAYQVHRAVPTGLNAIGRRTASLTAPYIHAGMLAQADLAPGMRVLEIGAGGPNAAMLAHIVGARGRVVTVDIDPEVTTRTSIGLMRIGLADTVRVVTADATQALGFGQFDRIVVTTAVSDIPPAWLAALAQGGVLVVPLRTGPRLQRVVGLVRDGDRFVARSVLWAGFVLAQGGSVHEHPAQKVLGPSGKDVTLTFETAVPETFALDARIPNAMPEFAWSGVRFDVQETWIDLLAYLTCVTPGAVTVSADEPADLGDRYAFLAGVVEGGSIAVMTRRRDGQDVELGAVGKGPDATRLVARLCAAIQQFDSRHRGGQVGVEWWPHPVLPAPDVVARDETTVLHRPHGSLVLHWPVTDLDEPGDPTTSGEGWSWRAPSDSRRRAWSPDAPPDQQAEREQHRPRAVRPAPAVAAGAAADPGRGLRPTVARWSELEAAFAANRYDGDRDLLTSLVPVEEPHQGVFVLPATRRPDTILTAVHGVNHRRDGKTKLADRGTGGLALAVAEAVGCGAVVTLDAGADANYDLLHPAKTALVGADMVERVIDLHGAAARPGRPDLGLGLGSGRIPHQFVAALLSDGRLVVDVDEQFTGASARRVTAAVQGLGQLRAVQVEIGARHRLPDAAPARLQTLLEVLYDALQSFDIAGPRQALAFPAIRTTGPGGLS